MVLHVRSAPRAAGLVALIRAAVQKLDRTVPIVDVHTVRDEIDRTLLRERLVRTVTSIFGGLALLLAATGLYGTVSHGVVRRTREFGIRIAVGAGPGRIRGLVLRDAAAWVVAGMATGLTASWLLSRTVSGLLFSVPAVDALSVAIASGVLIVTTFAAALIPVRRAARVDPVSALRMQ
jgi:ABC-type antimicrobial peptide transport system permease subunit